jgi:hypothetical protein
LHFLFAVQGTIIEIHIFWYNQGSILIYNYQFYTAINPINHSVVILPYHYVAVTEEERARQGMPDPEHLAAAAQAADSEQPATRERAVGAALQPPAVQQAQQGDQDGGRGTSVIRGAAIFVIVGALLRKLFRRETR